VSQDNVSYDLSKCKAIPLDKLIYRSISSEPTYFSTKIEPVIRIYGREWGDVKEYMKDTYDDDIGDKEEFYFWGIKVVKTNFDENNIYNEYEG
jgi:hypothetical protein